MDPQLVAKLIESGIKTSIPWSRDYNITPQIQTINKNLLKSKKAKYRLNNINEQYRVKTIQKQQSLSNSLILSEQRKKTILNQKQKQRSLHSKKVDDKLTKFHTTQRIMLKKATANQKKFSQTISQYWKDKLKQNQLKEKRIYKIYSKRSDGVSSRMSNSVELISVSGNNQKRRNESSLFSSMGNHEYEREKREDRRGDEVRSRMSELFQQKYDTTFQKMMKKLARIQKKKELIGMKSTKTEAQQNNTSIDYQTNNFSPKKIIPKNKIRIRDKIISSNSFIRQHKIIPYHLQNKQVRQSIQQNSFDEHTELLQNYKHRIKEINNIRQLRNKIIQKKLFIQRQHLNNNNRSVL